MSEKALKNDKSKTAWQKLRAAIWSRRIYLLVFFIPVIIMYVAYALFGVHPYGDNSVLVLDLNGQYVYYYEAMRDALHGDGSLMYDWSRNLSGEMFGIYGYYLASPFMLIICLLPRTWMCGAIETLQLMKIGCSAVTFAFFLRRRSKPSNTALVVFGSCYALMSYMVVQLMDPMWLDALVLLPLICQGVHRLVEDGKLVPYIVPLAIMFISHFYIGYMVGFFTFIYFVYVFFTQKDRVLPKHFVLRIIQFGAATLTAIMCAAIVILPVYNSLKLGKFEFTKTDWSLATQFDFLTFITKLFPMSYDTVYPTGLPMIYCGTAALLLVPLFFMNTRIPIKEKVGKGVMAAVLVIMMYIRPVDIFMHGLQVPQWLPYRYSFCFSFVLLTMAYRAWDESEGFTAKEIGGVFTGLLAFLFWCERENYEHFQIFEARTEEGETHGVIQGIWFAGLALIVYFVLIYLWKKYRGGKILSIVICALVSLELLVNCMDTVHKIDKDVAYSKYTSYEPYMSDTRDAVKALYQFDKDEFYRVESTFHRTVCDPIGTGYCGISHSSSTMNAPALKMLELLGYAYGGNYTKYDGETYITDAIFGIRYIMDKEDHDGGNRYKDSRANVPKEYTLATHIDETNALYRFYRNPYELGLGLVTNAGVKDVVLSATDPFENQNRLFNALISPDSDIEFFHKLKPILSEDENLRRATLTDGHKKFSFKDESVAECHIDYVVRMDKDSDLYMYLPTKYERSCNIWYQLEDEYVEGAMNMEYGGQFFVGDNYSILNLGRFCKNDEVRIRITIANDEKAAYWSDELFCTFDTEAFEQADAILRERVWNLTRHEDKLVEGTVTAQQGDYLFTTIPYEEGWTITVNGKDVKPEKSLESLITIPLEAGENSISMKFSPNYFRLAVIISLSGLVILLLIIVIEYKEGMLMRRLFVKAELREKSDGSEDTEDEPTAEKIAELVRQAAESGDDGKKT